MRYPMISWIPDVVPFEERECDRLRRLEEEIHRVRSAKREAEMIRQRLRKLGVPEHLLWPYGSPKPVCPTPEPPLRVEDVLKKI